ncbi:PLP-dependent aminotransferase family protein [Dactylosporangium matsuzakiense]
MAQVLGHCAADFLGNSCHHAGVSGIPGLDLHLELAAARPAQALSAALRSAIVAGRLAPRTRLPAARALAADLGLSRNTVAAVYAQLAAEGWLQPRVGAGTWVSDHTAAAGTVRRPRRPAAAPHLIDLRGGVPDVTGFPRGEWLAAVRAATMHAPAAEFGYGDPAGSLRLRAALAGYLARTRGVAAQPEGVVVGSGFGELLVLVCRALRARGARRLAVEAYGHRRHRRLIAATGLEPVPIPVDGDGADVTMLEGADADAVLLTPAHQFPLGVPLAAERRRWLVAWARRRDALVLEDDYDGEFRYDRRAVGALQALAPDRVVYLGTASKAVAPSVGLAWAAPPAGLRAEVLDQRELGGGAPAGLQQLALAAFIEAHEYDRSVRRLRVRYRERLARLEQTVARDLPGCALTGLAAGLQCLLRLPPGDDERRIERAARRRGVLLEGLAAFRADGFAGRAGPALVIGYGAPPPGRYDTALSLLVESIRAA